MSEQRIDVDAIDLAAWDRAGFLHVSGFLQEAQLDNLRQSVDAISACRNGEHEVMQHYEMTDGGVRICRSEHLIEGFELLRALLTDGPMGVMAGTLLGGDALLYKEKINYKLAGGAGFAPHQDAPAYPFVDTHVTCMLAIDDATIDNGCVEVVAGMHAEVLPMDDRGCIVPSLVESMRWTPMPIQSGDLLWFHSKCPHRSKPNLTSQDRRALFCTYNLAAAGNLRDRYYETKLAQFAQPDESDRVRVSLIGDFEGRPPTRDELEQHFAAVRKNDE